MNLTEVIVASSIFLGACGGAVQLSSSSAHAVSQSRQTAQLLEQVEEQLLAAAPVVSAGFFAGDPADCPAAAEWMRQQLVAGLPPVAPGVQRQLSLVRGGVQLQLVLSSAPALQRQRWLSPAAFGLCGTGAPDPSDPHTQESADATL